MSQASTNYPAKLIVIVRYKVHNYSTQKHDPWVNRECKTDLLYNEITTEGEISRLLYKC